MFEVLVVACAGTLAYEIDRNNCILFTDQWGPYKTEENCKIRGDDLIEFFTKTEEASMMVYKFLGFPPTFVAMYTCKKTEEEQI